MRHRTKLLVAVLPAALVALGAVACTQDFDAFEGGTSAPVSGDDAAQDGPAPRNDAATGTDAPSSDDADTDAGCAAAVMCKATETTCTQTCEDTRSTCRSGCGGDNTCRKKCDDDRDACRMACDATCRTCAGATCAATCN